MAFNLADRVKETSTTTGTGAFTLGGAVSGFQAFASGIAVNDTTWYAIAGGAEWEVGLGTLTATTTLARTTIFSSSNGNAAVSFSAGTKEVFITAPGDMLEVLTKVPIKSSGPAVRALTNATDYITPKDLADAMGFTTPTYAASFAPNWSTNGFNQSIVATANTTLTGPFTGGTDGEPVVIEYVQDATGSRTLAFNTTYFKIPPALTITASTAANAKDKLYGQLRLRSGTLVCEVTGFDKAVP